MYAFEGHYTHRDGPEDVDGYVTLRKIYWLIAHNIFRLKVNLIQDKYNQTRSHTDGFRRNNANYWNKREICRFYLYSSIIWFCPVLEELGK